MTRFVAGSARVAAAVVAVVVVTSVPPGCARVVASPPRHFATRGAIPPELLDLVTTKRAFAQLATVMRDGSPQVTPVWFDYDGRYIRVNSARGRVKDRNMRRDPRVALSILDPANPYRYLAIRGRVVRISEEGAVEHTNLLAKKYLGVDTNPNRAPDQVRVMYVIEPRRVSGQG